MNKQALQERADAMQVELDDLKALISKPSGPWMPECGGVYWAFTYYGKVQQHSNADQDFTNSQLAIGNCYQTREQAEAALDRQKLKTEIINTIAELNGGWVPDWTNGQQDKCSIDVRHTNLNGFSSQIMCWSSVQSMAENLFMKSLDAAEKLKEKYTPEQLTAAYWG